MFNNKLFALSIIFAAGSPALTMAETTRQHDAHEHGVSQLKIAIDKNQMQMVLEAPGSDIVGFEHEPENSEQKASVAQALDLLKVPSKLFTLPDEAKCTLTSAQSKFTFEEEEEHDSSEKHTEGHDKHEDEKHVDEKYGDKEHEEEGHAEFNATYVFNCSSPAKIGTIGVQFFKQFPDAEEIELQAVSEFGQLSAEVTKNQTGIDLSKISK
ncbi:MAG: DUF2796 domain-containing protein [Hyphomicrobiales bacterium]|nr:DUF2796 domain-containing protein [Hyphomicrobiales bacterium]